MSAAVKQQPATPLPYELREVTGQPSNQLTINRAGLPMKVVLWAHAYFRDKGKKRRDFEYLVHAGNAYPQLIEMLRGVADSSDPDRRGGDRLWPRIDALLRELGEA